MLDWQGIGIAKGANAETDKNDVWATQSGEG